jgi:hypothetical protein
MERAGDLAKRGRTFDALSAEFTDGRRAKRGSGPKQPNFRYFGYLARVMHIYQCP